MSKTIEQIVISTEGIDVISSINGVNNVTQLSLTEQEEERKKIFEENNLSTLTNYPFDEKIVRALASAITDNGEQLIDYMDTCRRSNYSKRKIEIPENIPEIVYDLKNLKNWFENIKDKKLRRNRQIEMFKTAKETERLLGKKVKLKMGILDRAYFTIQEFLQNRGKNSIQALNPGVANSKNTAHDEFVAELQRTTENTNEVSPEYVNTVEEPHHQTSEKDEELVQ